MPFLDEEAMAVAQLALAQPGPQGPQGPQGIQGIQGPPGADSTVPGPAGPSILSTVRQAADLTATNGTLQNTSLTRPVTAGNTYQFRFAGAYRSTVATVGLKLALTVPAVTLFTARAHISGFAADGSDSEWAGVINSSGDAVTATAAGATNQDLPWSIDGVLVPSANGNLTVQFAAETTGATVTFRAGSSGVLTVI